VNNYDWVLFDADDTLFHFDSFSGLKLLFSRLDVLFTEQHYDEYQLFNKSLWLDYQKGLISAQQVQCQRFDRWAARLNCSSHELNAAFLEAMAEICTPIEGALSLLDALKGTSRLGIITNGFTQLQQIRLERTGLKHYFDLLVISEQVGMAKPNKAIFDHALSLMGNPLGEQVLMVGDNPETDILGGLNAGFDTCWFNRDNKVAPEGIIPHYEVSTLLELEQLLLSETCPV
jgi:5'-nucleotidase